MLVQRHTLLHTLNLTTFQNQRTRTEQAASQHMSTHAEYIGVVSFVVIWCVVLRASQRLRPLHVHKTGVYSGEPRATQPSSTRPHLARPPGLALPPRLARRADRLQERSSCAGADRDLVVVAAPAAAAVAPPHMRLFVVSVRFFAYAPLPTAVQWVLCRPRA